MRPPRDSRRYRLRIRLLGGATALLIRLLGRTWRIGISGPDPFAPGTPFVAAIWHRGLVVAASCWRDRGLAVPVSQSRDGDLVDRVLQRLGFAESPRGSSSRGASALLRAMIRRVREGQVVAMLPDGPRGPAGEAKPGIIALAAATGVPLVPVGIAAAPRLRLGSWDAAILPWPFARVECRYGEPIHVPKRPDEAQVEALRRRLQDELHRLDGELESRLRP
jgi:lysophospholipid acyltransferase (LPLAT)-like uncharacterized protein